MIVGEAVSFPVYMAEPPRLSEILVPEHESIIYFVTMCVDGRIGVLANPKVFEATKAAIQALRRWHVLAAVMMPDHAHFIVTPREDRGLSIGDFATAFKRLLRKSLRSQDRHCDIRDRSIAATDRSRRVFLLPATH